MISSRHSADVVVTWKTTSWPAARSAVLEELANRGLQTPVVRMAADALSTRQKPTPCGRSTASACAATVEKTLPYLKKTQPAAKTARAVLA